MVRDLTVPLVQVLRDCRGPEDLRDAGRRSEPRRDRVCRGRRHRVRAGARRERRMHHDRQLRTAHGDSRRGPRDPSRSGAPRSVRPARDARLSRAGHLPGQGHGARVVADLRGALHRCPVERPWLEQADLVLGVGLDPVEPMPGSWPYEAQVVMLHSHPVETAYFGEPHLVVGSYADSLKPLVDCLRPDWPSGVAAEQRRRDVEGLEYPTQGPSPHAVVRETRLARSDALVTVDAGAHMLVAMPLWGTDEAMSVLISNGLATMGFSLPAAIGALARPDRRVVCFVGDGGLGMVLPELETVSRLGPDLTVVVLNDQALTLIRLKQKEHQGGDRAVTYGAVDFDGVATAMGVPGTVVTDLVGLRGALAATGAGPSLLDARIDPASYPHVMRATRG